MRIRLFDKKNQLIAELIGKNLPRGGQITSWDGVAMDGQPAVPGRYRMEVTAWDREFREFKGETKAKGLVTGVDFHQGETILTIDGQKRIFLRDVENFQLPEHNEERMLSVNETQGR